MSARRNLLLTYSVQGIECLGTNLLLLGIYFYTKDRLGFSARQNFLLAVGQNILYVGGSLLAHPLSARLGRKAALVVIFLAMSLAAAGALLTRSSTVLVTLLLFYSMATSFTWPILESLVATGGPPHSLSRRIGAYNLVWSSAAAFCIAGSGWLIQNAPTAIFLIPLIAHLVSIPILAWVTDSPHQATEAHPPADPELLPIRKLALALSRVSLPATYIAIYSLMSLFPSLPICREMSPTYATLLSSVWMISRWFTFLALGATSWWHARPRLLILSAILMVIAFLGTAVPGTRLSFWHAMSLPGVLAWMLAAQILLGVCLGTIYAASLYFGMVLSEGSTEHGGYHEALIGLGSSLGPLAGAAAATLRPGDPVFSLTGVTLVISLAVLATAVTPWWIKEQT